MRIALAQMKNQGSVEANLNQSIEWMREAAEHGADLILFPEVQLTEFFPQYQGQDVRRYRLGLESPEVQAFRKASREWNIWHRPTSIWRRTERRMTQVCSSGRTGRSRAFRRWYTSRRLASSMSRTTTPRRTTASACSTRPWGRIGIVVCFDRHYPESIRTEALMGADLILIPTVNTKAEPAEMFEWELRVQAFHNSAAIAMCNRVGCEGEMAFSGESIVVDANGQVLARAGDAEELLYADVDMAASRRIRESRPYTGLRRPEFYI